ncbi:hydrogenase expression protein HypF [Streptomyces zingiberis]|nr:hydrogenase expression protein HypF [Streptomyces zingiberis]
MLTRLHMPAGRAIALAAMPTAVLVGMGLSTPLAQADPQPKFRPGKCVSQADEPDEDETGKAEASDEDAADGDGGDGGDDGDDGKGATDDGEDGGDGTAGDERPSPSAAPEPGSSAGAGTGGKESGEDAGASSGASGDTGEPEPSPSASRNPLDPLGLGDKLGDLLGGGNKDEDEKDAESPSNAEDAAGKDGKDATGEPSATPSPSASGPGGGVTGAVRDSAGELVEDVRDTAGKAREKAGDAAEEATEEDAGAAATPSPSATAQDGLQPFPCPEYDAQALEDAEVDPEQPALLPDEPWILESSKLSLHGLDYKGIVKVRTWSGHVKEVMKFTATGVDIRDLHQLVQAPGGTTTHVKAAKGSNSTIRKGTVTMYTEKLQGNLFGIIPITFAPKSPPPLNLPEVVFTNVEVTQAGQFGGELTVPGMHLYDGG